MNNEPTKSSNDDVFKKGLTLMINAVKTSNELPSSGTNYVFYNSFPAFQTLMNAQASKILTIMQRCIDFEGAKGSVVENLTKRSISDRFDSLVEINDYLLEKVGSNLDDAAGVRTSSALLATSSVAQRGGKFGRFTIPGTKKSSDQQCSSAPDRRLAIIFGRPQEKFNNKPDNSRSAFRPRLQEKPHAILPLSKSLIVSVGDGEASGMEPSPHPYQMELEQFKVTLDDVQPGLKVKKSTPLKETPFMYIKTKHALEELVKLLKGEKEIGVDLEANSHRSYLGMTCLMQISTWTHDFVVDTLALWDDMQLLNVIFADPKILKIFHDGSGDLMWLQRDFGIYVVNLFDTSIANKYLEARERVGLLTLLNTYCDVSTNKKYQTADWRRRPLPEAMLEYARIDSHYLPEICRHQRQQFVARERRQQLLDVWNKCRQLCLRRYEKPLHTDDSYLDVAQREVFRSLNAQQEYAIRALYNWRDEVARLEDESPQYVMPNHMLLMISKTLPREHAGVFACCNPVPQTVRRYIHDIHKHVRDAREVDTGGKTKAEYQPEPTISAYVDSLPHDLSHRESHEPAAHLDAEAEMAMIRKLSKEMYSPVIRLRSPAGVGGGGSLPVDPLTQYRLSARDIENEASDVHSPLRSGENSVNVPPPPPPVPATLPPPSPPPPPPPPQEEQFLLQNKTGKKKKRKRKPPQGEESQEKAAEQVVAAEAEAEIEAFDYSKAKLPRSDNSPAKDRMVNMKVKETKMGLGGGKKTKKLRMKGKLT